MKLVLASSSPFRAAILRNLALPFAAVSPEVDEARLPGEAPQALAESFVIGSDQVATLDGDVLGKPHTVENAVAQLSRFSGREVQFLTGLCLRRGDVVFSCVEPFVVRFRPLTEAEIRAYVALESPLQCAGSFKSEGLGILLFDALVGRDPNALVGLPLIALRELFEQHGVALFAEIERAAQAD